MEATVDGEVIIPANKFLCTGNENSLIDCPHSLDGDYYCYHAAVTCLPVITGEIKFYIHLAIMFCVYLIK